MVDPKVVLKGLRLGDVLEQQMYLSFVLETMVETNEVRVVHFVQQLYLVMNSFLFLWLDQLVFVVYLDGEERWMVLVNSFAYGGVGPHA